MSRIAFVALTIGLLLVSGRARAADDKPDLPELAAQTSPSVVLLAVENSLSGERATGSGFFVTKSGWVVTNFHVIDGASKVLVKLSDGSEKESTGLIASDPDYDVAIIAVDGSGYPALELSGSGVVRPGDEVVVVGSPLGLAGTLTAGIVSAIRKDDDGKGIEIEGRRLKGWGIQVSAAISPGSSGSPIMTREGKVIAVAVGTAVAGQNINFGVPIETVQRMLAKVSREQKPEPFGGGGSLGAGVNIAISVGAFALFVFVYYFVTRRGRRREAKA